MEDTRKNILEAMKKKEDKALNAISYFIKIIWDKDIYKNVEIVSGSIMNAPLESDVTIPIAVSSRFEKGLERRVKDKFREVEVVSTHNRKIGENNLY